MPLTATLLLLASRAGLDLPCCFLCSGGLEHLFDNRKKIDVRVPGDVSTLGDLIQWVRVNLVRERHDMFVQGSSVRPGVLVLVNDVDWELEGTLHYKIAEGDRFAFISTLHGG